MNSRLVYSLLVTSAVAMLANSGCVHGIAYAVAYQNERKLQRMKDEANEKRPEYERKLEREVSNADPYDNAERQRATNDRIRAAESGLKDTSLDGLAASIDNLIAAMDKEKSVHNRPVDQRKVDLYSALPGYVRDLKAIRDGCGDYINFIIGRYDSCRPGVIKNAIPELKDMKTAMEPYKDDPNVSKVYKEVNETLNYAIIYSESNKPFNMQEARRQKAINHSRGLRERQAQLRKEWEERQRKRERGW